MIITILCSSSSHPVNGMLYRWVAENQARHTVNLVRQKAELQGGDILFLISCGEKIAVEDRQKFGKVLVIHASDLPTGRGWNPHIWSILEGAETITVSLLEAEDKVDSGAIWKKLVVPVPKHALFDEINEVLFEAESQLMSFAVSVFDSIAPEPQDSSVVPSYYPRRSPEDSELDSQKSIAEQFDLLRVCDPQRFPAFFKLHGHTYRVTVEKVE